MIDIVDKGRDLFDLIAVLKAGKLDPQLLTRFEKWIAEGRAGELEYLKRGYDRTDPSLILKDVKSVVVVAKFYDTIQTKTGIARFAQGDDYHMVIKENLHRLLQVIRSEYPKVKGRAVVDTAPIFEKAWATEAGFGFIGRNSLVVNPQKGSFFNLGLLLLDMEFPVKSNGKYVDKDFCSGCRLCIDSCPMHAIGEDRMIDTRRCISALTVEKVRHGEDVKPIFGWSYGCDVCQLCCPYNNLYG